MLYALLILLLAWALIAVILCRAAAIGDQSPMAFDELRARRMLYPPGGHVSNVCSSSPRDGEWPLLLTEVSRDA